MSVIIRPSRLAAAAAATEQFAFARHALLTYDRRRYENTFFQKSVKTMQRGGTFTLEHKGVKHTGVTAQLSVDDSCLEFSSANAAWTVGCDRATLRLELCHSAGSLFSVGLHRWCVRFRWHIYIWLMRKDL